MPWINANIAADMTIRICREHGQYEEAGHWRQPYLSGVRPAKLSALSKVLSSSLTGHSWNSAAFGCGSCCRQSKVLCRSEGGLSFTVFSVSRRLFRPRLGDRRALTENSRVLAVSPKSRWHLSRPQPIRRHWRRVGQLPAPPPPSVDRQSSVLCWCCVPFS